MLKITHRGKRPERRRAYLSSISFKILFMHPHKHRTNLARLSENIRLKQQQTGFILESHPRTDAGETLLNISNRGNDIKTHDKTALHASASSIQMNQKGLLSKIDLAGISSPYVFIPKWSQCSHQCPPSQCNRKINALNTFCCYTSDCSLLPFDSENHHFCFRHTQKPPL